MMISYSEYDIDMMTLTVIIGFLSLLLILIMSSMYSLMPTRKLSPEIEYNGIDFKTTFASKYPFAEV